MNARFNMCTPEEAAKTIGVSTPVVTGWCRNGVINCNKIGGGLKKDRYEIADEEVNYIHKLIQKFGKREGILHYRKDWAKGKMPAVKSAFVKEREKDKALREAIESVRKVATELVSDPNEEYKSNIVAQYIGVDESLMRRFCKDERINCRTAKNTNGKGNVYYIPGWEAMYLKKLYDKYGKVGRFSAMHHYVKDRDDTAEYSIKKAALDAQAHKASELKSEVIAKYAENKTDLNETVEAMQKLDEMASGVIEYKRPASSDTLEYRGFPQSFTTEKIEDSKKKKREKTPEELAVTLDYILQVKARIKDCEEELEGLRNEYDELKREIDEALEI